MTIDLDDLGDDLARLLKEHLTIEVGYASNDPEDDTRTVSLWWGEEKITEADL